MSAQIFYVDISTISFGGTGAVIGGDESQFLTERLLEMYRLWAAAQGIGFEQIEKTPAYGGGIRCVKFSLSGVNQASFAALHDGTHTLVRIPPEDPNQRRHMSIAGVRSSNNPALPLPVDMDDWGAERRRLFLRAIFRLWVSIDCLCHPILPSGGRLRCCEPWRHCGTSLRRRIWRGISRHKANRSPPSDCAASGCGIGAVVHHPLF